MLKQHLGDCDATSLAKHISADHPEHLQLLSQAVHLGTDTDTLLSLLTGSLGLPAAAPAVAEQNVAATGQKCPPKLAAAGATAAAVMDSLGLGLPFLPLVGVLADKYGHNARELGGPVTEALAHAQLSTVARVQDLEGRCKALHK